MKRQPQFDSETQLATAFMTHLESLGWDCYPEVAVNRGGNRADIIAYRKPLVWVVEAKLSLNEAVCEQAKAWLGWAHLVTVLAPGGKAHPVLEEWCRIKGVGIIRASRHTTYRQTEHIGFDNRLEARLHRSVYQNGRYIADHLHPDMKRYAPGTNAQFSSPWRRTMDAAIDCVLKNPGVGIKEIVAAIKHHYHSDATARACLVKWLQGDKRVRCELHGRSYRFFGPGETTNQQQELVA